MADTKSPYIIFPHTIKGRKYYFKGRVRAINGRNSAWSDWVGATAGDTTIPSAISIAEITETFRDTKSVHYVVNSGYAEPNDFKEMRWFPFPRTPSTSTIAWQSGFASSGHVTTGRYDEFVLTAQHDNDKVFDIFVVPVDIAGNYPTPTSPQLEGVYPNIPSSPSTTLTISSGTSYIPYDGSWITLDSVTLRLTRSSNGGTTKTRYALKLPGSSSYSTSVTSSATTIDIPLSSEGITLIKYYSYDINYEDLQETEQEVQIKWDKTAPTVTINEIGTNWYRRSVTASGTYSDSVSGIFAVYVNGNSAKLSSGIWQADVVFADDGANQTISVYAVDNAGNISSTATDTVNIDITPPNTYASLSGTANGVASQSAPNENGWWNGDVTMTLTASDDTAGVSNIFYQQRVVGGSWGTTTAYSSAVTINSDGQYEIRYWSVDVAGNAETYKNIAINIDKTVPTYTGVLGGAVTGSIGAIELSWANSGSNKFSDATSGLSGLILYRQKNNSTFADSISDVIDTLYTSATAYYDTTPEIWASGSSNNDYYYWIKPIDNAGNTGSAQYIGYAAPEELRPADVAGRLKEQNPYGTATDTEYIVKYGVPVNVDMLRFTNSGTISISDLYFTTDAANDDGTETYGSAVTTELILDGNSYTAGSPIAAISSGRHALRFPTQTTRYIKIVGSGLLNLSYADFTTFLAADEIEAGTLRLEKGISISGTGTDYMIMTQNTIVGYVSGNIKFKVDTSNGVISIGDTTSSDYLEWDNGTLFIRGNMNISDFPVSAQGYSTDIEFYSTGYDSVEWSAGYIKLSDGTIYSIDSGSASSMSDKTYIYCDGTTTLKTSTDYSDAVASGTFLIAIATPQLSGGCLISTTVAPGTTIVGSDIVTGDIQSNNWGPSSGSKIALTDGTFYLGGSSAPKLSWDGSTLSVTGAITVDGGDAFKKNVDTSDAIVETSTKQFVSSGDKTNWNDTKTTVDSNKATWDLAGNFTTSGTLITSKLEGIIDAASNNIQGGTSNSVTISSYGVKVVNTSNSDHFLKLDAGSLAITTDGGTTLTTAITASGIIADTIYTGTLNANNVAIQSTNSGATFSDIVGVEINGKGIQAYSSSSKYAQLTSSDGLKVIGGSITGGTISTSTGYPRITLAESDNKVTFYDSTGTAAIKLGYATDGANNGLWMNSTTQIFLSATGGVSTTIDSDGLLLSANNGPLVSPLVYALADSAADTSAIVADFESNTESASTTLLYCGASLSNATNTFTSFKIDGHGNVYADTKDNLFNIDADNDRIGIYKTPVNPFDINLDTYFNNKNVHDIERLDAKYINKSIWDYQYSTLNDAYAAAMSAGVPLIVTGTIDINGSPFTINQDYSRIIFFGAKIINSGSRCNAIEITSDYNSITGDLTIDGEASNLVNHGMYFNYSHFNRIGGGFFIKRCYQNGLRFYNQAKENIISGVHLIENGADGASPSLMLYTSDNNFFNEIYIISGQASGNRGDVQIYQSDGCNFHNSVISDAHGYGLEIKASTYDFRWIGGSIGGCYRHGVVFTGNSKNCGISDCMIHMNGTESANTYNNVQIDGSYHNQIHNNNIFPQHDPHWGRGTLTTSDNPDWDVGDSLTGETSGATCDIVDGSGNTWTVNNWNFVDWSSDETIDNGGATGTYSSFVLDFPRYSQYGIYINNGKGNIITENNVFDNLTDQIAYNSTYVSSGDNKILNNYETWYGPTSG